MIPTIITLSSIPPRFAQLTPTLKSLLAQSDPAQEIRLYIPQSYRRFPDWDGVLPHVPDGIAIYRCDVDLGPATKVLPAAADLRGQDLDILFCDDDKIYDRNWHRRFKTAAANHLNTCIVEVGETFPDIADTVRPPNRLPRGKRARKTLAYRLKRALTLTLYKPHIYRNSGYVDQISGFGGVLVKPDWFDEEAYDIPSILWTVDDPWLSGHLERRGIPIWLNGKGKLPTYGSGGRLHALLDLVEDGHGRIDADLAVIDYMRKRYGIWKKGGAPSTEFNRMTSSMRELVRRRNVELADQISSRN